MKNIFSRRKKMSILESLKLAALGGLENSYVNGSFRLKPMIGDRAEDSAFSRFRPHRNNR